MLRLNAYRGLTAQMKYGVPGPEGSLGKWHWAEVNQSLTELAMDIAGPARAARRRPSGRTASCAPGPTRSRAARRRSSRTSSPSGCSGSAPPMNYDFNDEQRAIKESARGLLATRYPLEEVRRLALEDERGFTDEQWAEIVLARLAGDLRLRGGWRPGSGDRRAGDPPGGARLRPRADAVLLQRLRGPAPGAAGRRNSASSTCARWPRASSGARWRCGTRAGTILGASRWSRTARR